MPVVDHFASTARGLFLGSGGKFRDIPSIPLIETSLPVGALAIAEVQEAPADCRVGKLEIIESVPASQDFWQTSEVSLKKGLRLVVALGGRFANRSISGLAPDRPVSPGTILDLLNTGGVAGIADQTDEPLIKLKILGGVECQGKAALVSDFQTIPSSRHEDRDSPGTPLVLITGSDMEVGKTTCAASLSNSLRAAGIRISYAKLTGTGRMRDLMQVCYGRPAGHFDSERLGWDFVDAGLATTFGVPSKEVRRSARMLLRHAAARSEIVLAEIADAPNTEGSVDVATDPWLKTWIQKSGLLICACDSVSSTLIVQWIRSHFDIDENAILISGKVASDSSLSAEVKHTTGLAVVSSATPSGLSPPESRMAGGALADWVIRHIMARRKVAK